MTKSKTTLGSLLAKAAAAPQPKAPSHDAEHQLQMACVRWFNLQYPELRGRLFAVPNGGRRDAVTGARLKAEGVVAGVADLVLLKSNRHHGALLIEMKRRGGRQSDSQRWWQSVVCQGDEYKYVVCRSLGDFMREVRCYLADVAFGGTDDEARY